MTAATDRRAGGDESDAAEAATRLILGLTLSTGGMLAASGAATGSPTVVVALPALLMGGLLLLGAIPAACWCGVAIWLLVMPMARSEGILAALAMMAICGVVALGPERLSGWFADRREPPPDGPDVGWIEEA